jgi:hypothetical protein
MGKNEDPGSGINIPDPQHCFYGFNFLSVCVVDPDPVGSGVFCPSRIRNNCTGSGSENYKTTFEDWKISKWFANFLLNGLIRL